jgi:hypothetical protein
MPRSPHDQRGRRLQLNGRRGGPRNCDDDRAEQRPETYPKRTSYAAHDHDLSITDLARMWCSPPVTHDGHFLHALPKQQHSWIFHLRQRGGVDFRAAS